MKSIFGRDIQLFGTPVRLMGAAGTEVRDLTHRGPDTSPPPTPEAAEMFEQKAVKPPYPGKSHFGSSCPVCR